MNKDREWLKKMAAKEDGNFVSVGGLVTDIEDRGRIGEQEIDDHLSVLPVTLLLSLFNGHENVRQYVLNLSDIVRHLRNQRDEARLTARSQNNLVAALKPEHATVFPWEAPKGGE